MKKIGLLSDTHGYLDPAIFEHFESCDEIWHAGDIGSIEIIDQLEAFKPVRIVFGNIDGHEIRIRTTEYLHFELEGLSVQITHIGGYPPRYNPPVRKQLKSETPDIFICGHSHILRVMRDPALNQMLYINPGAAGREGFHAMRTAITFVVDAGKVSQMAVIELGKRGAIS
jgi:putative phosphoesterase